MARLPDKPFTSWRALVYYMKTENTEKGPRLQTSGNIRHLQKHRKLAKSSLNTSVTMDVEVDNDLQCPICLELYTYPIILPCSHVLCRSPCAEQLFDFNFIRCPVCRDNCYVSGGISSLPRVIALENIIERYKTEQKKEKPSTTKSNSKQTTNSPQANQSDTNENLAKSLSLLNSSVTTLSSLTESFKTGSEIKCQNCKSATRKRAKKYCLTCESNFCATCLRQNHPNKDPFTDHEFTEPKEHSSNKVSSKSTSSNASATPGSTYRDIIDCYCTLCAQPFCSGSDDRLVHNSHSVLPIENAYKEFKNAIEENADKLSSSQAKVVTSLKDLKDGLKDVQHVLSRRRDEINVQCDMLLAEIENKRSYFLADLEYEERINSNSIEDSIKRLEKVLGASQGLQGYVKDVLSSEKAPFLEIASTLNERVQKATRDCESASTVLPLDTDNLNYKVVDCRREKVLLNELHYLSPPSTPIVDVTRCSRSESTVVLALCPPTNVHEVVDQYEVHFCSEEQKNVELEETVLVKNSVEDSSSTKISANASGVLVLLLENLCRSATYYFCLSASNLAGKSGSSEVVQCTTLADGENVIPAPSITERLCKRFTSSIQIFSSSPVDVAAEQKISHFLLYRQPSQNRVWKCVSMYGREEHRVFGLAPSTEYEFVILAYNQRGECQLSNKVLLQTESSSSF
ncbi:E3 ubiquitin-protein ligase Midline-1-like isoform X2 [Ruditapes philippinarum]|uniref:E3 ubiquitin-protein ligase Midline-1-like isoform X2 n=1 Tax=Ruditapes philippinarum TaxID=129788 RepID=UPI00295BAC89|nr:E3 ubiquitin-protein ligase Midline-1-like isoform X2 [Ruditapes philippinarum]